MAHGYYNLKGEFVTTSSLEEATTAWRAERGYSTGGVYTTPTGIVDTTVVAKMATAPPAVPRAVAPTDATVRATAGVAATGPTALSRRDEALAPAVPALAPAPTSGYNVQSIQNIYAEPAALGDSKSARSIRAGYDIRSVQGISEGTIAGVSPLTPTEQRAAGGGGIPSTVTPYKAGLAGQMQAAYSQFPESVGGVGTPTELRAGGGYGPSSYQWSESAGSLGELAQGRTPPGPALLAADTVEMFLTEWGVRPEFVTPFVTQSLGMTPTNMIDMGYVQDLYGRWIALDFGDEEPEVTVTGGADYEYSSTGGYSGAGSYGSPASFRSGYTSGLIQWRIGF